MIFKRYFIHIKENICASLAAITLLTFCACTQTAEPPHQTGSSQNTDGKVQEGAIKFSKSAGFYPENSITVDLEAADGWDIYYTTDCSSPSPENGGSIKYSEPITIMDKSSENGSEDKVTVIRAAAVKNGSIGKIYTSTYILNGSAQKFADRYGGLGVFSINTDNKYLFGDEGIYTNYTEHGRETERAASVEFFEVGGSCEVSMQAGIRIYGGTSRGLAQKSLKITARKEYGDAGKFKYAFFENNNDKNGNLIEEYDTVILRAGGNDSLLTGERSTQLRDVLVHTVAMDIDNLSSQAGRPVVLYLNGNYWGLYFLREDLDDDYIESHYKVDKNNIAILTYGHENGNWFYKLDEGTEADQKNYQQMLAYIIGHDMKNSSYYSEACKMLDIDNFIKYMALNIYVNNRDWPHNNVRMWRYIGTADSSNQYTDGKWRFMIKDTDFSMGRYYAPGQPENVVAQETSHNESVIKGEGSEIAAAFGSLLGNDEFRIRFVNFMCDTINAYCSEASASEKINKFRELMRPEMKYHMTCRWNGDKSISMTEDEWESYIDDTLISYVKKRPSFIKRLLKKTLIDEKECTLVVNIENGGSMITLNTVDISSWRVWVGTYFRSTDIPLEVETFAGHNIDELSVSSDDGSAYYKNGILYFKDSSMVTVNIKIS